MDLRFANCEQDLSRTGFIQSFGSFVQVDSTDFRIVSVSENISSFLPLQHTSIIGCHAEKLHKDICSFLQSIPEGSNQHIYLDTLEVTATRTSDGWLIHFEKCLDQTPVTSHPFVGKLANNPNEAAVLKTILHYLRDTSGFKRVMLYRFLPDFSGEVVAEICPPEDTKYKGLRYPASDIPKVARELYLKTPYRYIYDARAEPVAIHSRVGADTRPPDLSLSLLRSVSPFHVSYLTNMGVTSSFSIPVVLNDKLSALFAFHNSKPVWLDHRQRTCIVDAAGKYTEYKRMLHLTQQMALLDQMTREIKAFMVTIANTGAIDDDNSRTILSLMEASAAGLYYQGKWSVAGHFSSLSDLQLISDRMTADGSGVRTTDQIASISDELNHLSSTAAGCCAIWVRSPDHRLSKAILFLRQEVIQEVTWGSKTVFSGNDNPTNSFGLWQESMRGHSAPWSEASLTIAKSVLAQMHVL